mmetsp:Transcript_23116/g.64278  ORF Transcript_23116/g.64278 Transcript_23116/m.64278 type:complete len:112 (+) Transcript_23116:71-406(+)|eukprot:CAMPEP_0168771806 /NCGR_PEP_ID=MMETSP0725-20121227/3628_1 /TAXON_ID=265536 /ORGANISM="Amphiprora sp., Strain CCMP467" /LENGTH=111 /DNA_ID=CAMNT_0008821299 /DNA_START=69 /DNA_END=404 /DNA_ORIENTATION=+
MRPLKYAVLLLLWFEAIGFAFHGRSISAVRQKSFLGEMSNDLMDEGEADDAEVRLGSKEYYSGFVSRDVNEEPDARVTGDAVLIPTVKLVGGSSVVIGGLLLAFLASNGLL